MSAIKMFKVVIEARAKLKTIRILFENLFIFCIGCWNQQYFTRCITAGCSTVSVPQTLGCCTAVILQHNVSLFTTRMWAVFKQNAFFAWSEKHLSSVFGKYKNSVGVYNRWCLILRVNFTLPAGRDYIYSGFQIFKKALEEQNW